MDAVAALGVVAGTGGGPALGRAFGVGGAVRGRAGAEVVRVAHPGRRAAEGGGRLEVVGGAVRGGARAEVVHVAHARRRPAEGSVGGEGVRRTVVVDAVAALGHVAHARHGPAHRRALLIRGAEVGLAVAHLGQIAVAAGGAARDAPWRRREGTEAVGAGVGGAGVVVAALGRGGALLGDDAVGGIRVRLLRRVRAGIEEIRNPRAAEVAEVDGAGGHRVGSAVEGIRIAHHRGSARRTAGWQLHRIGAAVGSVVRAAESTNRIQGCRVALHRDAEREVGVPVHVGVEEGAGIPAVVAPEGDVIPVPAHHEVEGCGGDGVCAEPGQVLLARLVHRTLEVGCAPDGRRGRGRTPCRSHEHRHGCAPRAERGQRGRS